MSRERKPTFCAQLATNPTSVTSMSQYPSAQLATNPTSVKSMSQYPSPHEICLFGPPETRLERIMRAGLPGWTWVGEPHQCQGMCGVQAHSTPGFDYPGDASKKVKYPNKSII
jgi:hypothetical protein